MVFPWCRASRFREPNQGANTRAGGNPLWVQPLHFCYRCVSFLDAGAPAKALSRRLRLTEAHLRELLRGGVEGWTGLLSLVSFRKSFRGIEPSSTGPSWAAVYCHHWPSATSHTVTTAAARASQIDAQPAQDAAGLLAPISPQGHAISIMRSSAVHKLGARCCDYEKAERVRTHCRSHVWRTRRRT